MKLTIAVYDRPSRFEVFIPLPLMSRGGSILLRSWTDVKGDTESAVEGVSWFGYTLFYLVRRDEAVLDCMFGDDEEILVYCQLVLHRTDLSPTVSRHPGRRALPCLPSRIKQVNTHMISPEPTGAGLTWLEGTGDDK